VRYDEGGENFWHNIDDTRVTKPLAQLKTLVVEGERVTELTDDVEYHTLYGVDRTRLTTRLPVTVLGKDSQYGRIVCGMCCEMSGPERSSRRQ
jgi:hypothetical protein